MELSQKCVLVMSSDIQPHFVENCWQYCCEKKKKTKSGVEDGCFNSAFKLKITFILSGQVQ